MNPLVYASDNVDKLYVAAEWAVAVGGDDAHRQLWEEWNTGYKHRFQWIASCQGRIQYYGNMDLEGQSLSVKCDFLKVNNCVLMLFQPSGRFSAHNQMENQVQAWLGNSDRFPITNAMNFHNNQIWEELKGEGMQSEETSFPYGAKSAVLIENEYHLNQFVEKAKSWFAKRDVSCIRLPQSEIKEYKLDEAENGKMPMYVQKQADLINGFVVTSFYNSGNYGDQQVLQEKAKEWFPNARQFVSKERLPELLSMLERPGFAPTAYRSLVETLEAQPIATINLSSVGENDIPDEVVSSSRAMEEMGLERYYQQKDPTYQSPQKLLCDRYLSPRLTVLRNEIFPAMKIKMNESQKRGFKAEMGHFSALAFDCAGRIMVTLRENDGDDYISLSGSDSISNVGEMGIKGYYGNLPNLVKILEAISQNWDIEKFVESDRVSMI